MKTERSPLIGRRVKNFGDEFRNMEEVEDEKGGVCKDEDPLLGDASQEDYVPNGGWGWIVTLAAFVIWVRQKRSML